MHARNVAADGQLAPQVADHARDLHHYVLRLARVLLDQPLIRLLQEAALLLDQQQVPGAVHHGEIDFAVDGVAAVHRRPVHGVIDGVVVGQPGLEQAERLDLALRGAGDGQFAPAVGDDAGHGIPARLEMPKA